MIGYAGVHSVSRSQVGGHVLEGGGVGVCDFQLVDSVSPPPYATNELSMNPVTSMCVYEVNKLVLLNCQKL